jgi:protoporphyrinogen oxidase
VTVFLRYLTKNWQKLEQEKADVWMRKYYGDKVYENTWRPIIINKFGPYYQQVNMAWMWARLVARSFRLGYFEGGFQTLVDGLANAVTERGGTIKFSSPVQAIAPETDGRVQLTVNGEQLIFDKVMSTTSPHLLAKMAPDLPKSYLEKLLELKNLGAVVMVFALKETFFEDGTYWLNVPAFSPDKFKNEFPFLALVEHTNYVDKKHYGGETILYCGDYVPPDHPYFDMSEAELAETFTSHFQKINPKFRPDWIRKKWLFRAKYAQPVPLVNHSQNIPAIQTPIPNLYFASMSQVYPWDRGTNFAVQIGRNTAKQIVE